MRWLTDLAAHGWPTDLALMAWPTDLAAHGLAEGSG